ncbi:amino acid ABC transporter ATP-binding protein [Mesorhizobium sp. LHD-90]|uniref:amino acid ABC transporter ATP-binding protein n=1 Tax=Mesorhizobium sp. LHD-90 TaxID=3071414 RepID=UPI0027E0B049|nr:amino acid ABC transporter ATP-binding protein [Mesorhizobium sp. LHD-90]MDQ6433217.1 amino acid ABC transporter ATP-binding protein [Mesorhizobium sp. LHD-90]
MSADAQMISVSGIHKSFDDHHVLKGIDLGIDKGEVVALVGPSGSGKSTLLRCLNLLVIPDRGEMRIGSDRFVFGPGARLPGTRTQANFRANTGMVFQHFNLFPHLSVIENVMEGPRYAKGMGREAAKAKACALLIKVGLQDKAAAKPNQLSGGQKQRVAIARALAMEPAVMLFDEATSALDPELVSEVLSVMRELAAEGMTMIIVTHEMSFARDVADKMIFMRDGQIVEQGSPAEVMDHSKNPSAQSFFSNFRQA